MSSRSSRSPLGAALGDLGVEQLVDFLELALELAPGPRPPKRRVARPISWAKGEAVSSSTLVSSAAQALQPRPLGDAEDDAQDHLQGDRLHARVDRELLAQRPGVDLGVDDLLEDRLVGAHPLAVEGGQHQLAVGEVVGALEQQQRAGAEDRLEDDVAAGRQAVLALRVEGLDRRRVGDHHHRPLEAEEFDAEAVAVASRGTPA